MPWAYMQPTQKQREGWAAVPLDSPQQRSGRHAFTDCKLESGAWSKPQVNGRVEGRICIICQISQNGMCQYQWTSWQGEWAVLALLCKEGGQCVE